MASCFLLLSHLAEQAKKQKTRQQEQNVACRIDHTSTTTRRRLPFHLGSSPSAWIPLAPRPPPPPPTQPPSGHRLPPARRSPAGQGRRRPQRRRVGRCPRRTAGRPPGRPRRRLPRFPPWKGAPVLRSDVSSVFQCSNRFRAEISGRARYGGAEVSFGMSLHAYHVLIEACDDAKMRNLPDRLTALGGAKPGNLACSASFFRIFNGHK